MLFTRPLEQQSPLRQAITNAYRMDENQSINDLLSQLKLTDAELGKIKTYATQFVLGVREKQKKQTGLDSFLYEYDLSSEEGIALMCLAEALLRIPDKKTIDQLIRDKIASADWASHSGKSDSLFVNAATWGLMLTGKFLRQEHNNSIHLGGVLKKVVEKSGEPVLRKAVEQAMKILGKQFVMGRNIEEAIKRAKTLEAIGFRYSYDMLGEAARTSEDAVRYFNAYQQAIQAIGHASTRGVIEGPGISVKLSALHPRYEFAKRERVIAEVSDRLLQLAQMAKAANIGLTVDAEESARLELSLDIMEKVFADPSLQNWEGFGLALQAYQKRAWYVIDWLRDLSKRHHKRIMLRLVKGAYWDSEIKESQVFGLSNYPVFTRKTSTDVSYLACAKKILQNTDVFYPQFATHNAHTVAAILAFSDKSSQFEFQCLHGMGQALYDQIVGSKNLNIPCRVYAPVGVHEDLLAYLVRRLLENGANTSFVNRLAQTTIPIDEIISDPVAQTVALDDKRHPKIPLPKALFGLERVNSSGIDLTERNALITLQTELDKFSSNTWSAGSIVNGRENFTEGQAVQDPSDHRRDIGAVSFAKEVDIELALSSATQGYRKWDLTSVEERAACLNRIADLFEIHRAELMALAIREAGKTVPDAISEVREAIDFCRYYAKEALHHLATPQVMPGYTGESNTVALHGRGVIVCISPWNFPLAIFTGQLTAALAAGNAVIAKPAEQTSLIANYAVKLFHQAGIPTNVLHLLPGKGEVVGAKLVADQRVAGVVFTGSTETARIINQTLANKQGPINTLIAETGGQNAMLIDSTALPEQVVRDVIFSAFNSAGQRCSALRVLFLQEDVADKMITMLKGAMAELDVGDPALLATDIGPVIDKDAQQTLEKHLSQMHQQGKLIYQVKLPEIAKHGTYIPPSAFEIDSISQLKREVFGPILHVVRYKAKDLDKVISDINDTGYGLTLGIHSRIDEKVAYIHSRIHAGNCYVNRNVVGAVVGVQPFGGEGLSGTGPKAGGPHYLMRLCTERTLTIDTTAAGGNASLVSLQE